MQHRLVPFLVIIGLACAAPQAGPATDGVRLGVEPNTVSPGGSITLVLSNGSSGPIGYNLCSSALERRMGEGWEVVPTDIVCTMELRSLEAGGTIRHSLNLPSDVGPGQYRYRTAVEKMDTGERVSPFSETFEVEL